jgi:signal transduction histidine kinase
MQIHAGGTVQAAHTTTLPLVGLRRHPRGAERGRIPDLEALVDDVIGRFDFSGRGVVTVCDSGEVPLSPHVVIDVLDALLANAATFTPTGATVIVSAFAGRAGLVLTVEDDAAPGAVGGSPPGPRRESIESANVALQRLRRLAEQVRRQGGVAWIEPAVDRGTVVVVDLPYALTV